MKIRHSIGLTSVPVAIISTVTATGIVLVAEITEYAFRFLGPAGNLLAEEITLTEFVPDDLNNIIRVTVRLGEDQCLWNLLAIRKQLGIQVLFESVDHSADLAGIDDVPVKLCGCIMIPFRTSMH